MLSIAVLKQSIQMALQNIRGNKMRSFLTMLGIMIGVGSVIGLITMVQIASDNVMGKFSKLGAGTLTIYTYESPVKSGLSETDLKDLASIEGVGGISPTISFFSTAANDKEAFKKIRVEGKNAAYFAHNKDIIKAGRAFNENDMSGDVYVCIVDEQFIRHVLLGKQVLGSTVRIAGYKYTIVGIRDKDNGLGSMFTDTSKLDGSVMIPYTNALSITGAGNVTQAEVYTADGYELRDIESKVRSALKNIYNENDDFYQVINMDGLMDMMDQVYALLGTMLGGIASIALVVGGIGIMNMMLTSVSERTKEIGLRKALGAEPSRIQIQFLIESVVLSVCGGIIGIIIGIILAAICAVAMDAEFSVSGGAIALGFGFSGAVGVIFGWMPAKRASELNPIDALRSE